MFPRSYPDRVTTHRILAENRLAILARMREWSSPQTPPTEVRNGPFLYSG